MYTYVCTHTHTYISSIVFINSFSHMYIFSNKVVCIINMVVIKKQSNSTNKNYRREKIYYVSLNYGNSITQYKRSIIVDIKKRHILKTASAGP